MNQNHYSFCDYTDSDYNQLKEILKTAFEIEKFKQINDAYEDFITYFNNKKPRNQLQNIERCKMKPRTENNSFANKFTNPDYIVGIDLPILFKPDQEKENGKSIFILAEDPLRNFNHNNIILSTPFGLHIENGKTKRKGRVMWKLIENILDKGFQVYLTDIKKVWMAYDLNKGTEKKQKLKKETIPYDLQENFRKALKLEIEWIKPQKIMAFGKDACDALNSYQLDFNQTYFYPHTAAYTKDWIKFFNHNNFEATNAKNDTKLNFIMSNLNL